MGRLSRITAAAVGLALGAGLPACGGAGHSRRAATAPSTSSSVAQSSASVSSSPQPPPNPGRVARPGAGVFRGRIVLASGQASGAVGAVSVRLRSGVQGALGPATVTIISAPCPGATHCRRLQGTLRGTLTAVHSLPDVGRRFALSAHGTLTSLGAVSATGVVATPGNIRAGMETLTIEVAGRGARFSLVARSGLVPGFSGP